MCVSGRASRSRPISRRKGPSKLIRRLNGWNESQIGGYEVFLNDYHKMDQLSDRIYALDQFPRLWQSQTIRQVYPNIFDWLDIQDTNQNILITIMTLIALINLI